MNIQTKPRIVKLLAVAAACLAFQSANAQLLFSDAFNYTPDSELGGNTNPGNSIKWTGGNTALSIGSSDLTYDGLVDQGGNDVVYTSGVASSTSVNTYSAVTSGSIYFSFLINCTTLPTANNYIMALNPGTTGPGGSGDAMATYVGASGEGFKIGVRNGNSGASYSDTLALGTTYFVVEELILGATPTVNLFLNPIPGTAQPVATATQTGTVAVTSVADIGIKAQSAATAGNYLIDNLLVGQTWADVTPTATPEPSTLALAGLGGFGLLGLALRNRRARA